MNHRKVMDADVSRSCTTRQNLFLSHYKVHTAAYAHRANDDDSMQQSKRSMRSRLGVLKKAARRKVAVGAAFVCTLLSVGNPLHASTASAMTSTKEKEAAGAVKKENKLPIVKAAAAIATGVSVKRYFFRNKMDDDDESKPSSGLRSRREAKFREIMGIQPPSEDSSAAAVFVSEDDVIDDDEKSKVEAWFKRASGESSSASSDVGTTDEQTTEREEFNQTSPVAVSVVDKEAELKALAEAKAAEDARLAEEAWIAKQELIAEEKRISEEAAARVEAEKLAAMRLEEAEMAAKAALAKEEIMTVPQRRKMLAQTQKRTPMEDAELSKYYSEMTEQEKAFYILADLDIVSSSPDPEDPSYDGSNDDEFCSDYQ